MQTCPVTKSGFYSETPDQFPPARWPTALLDSVTVFAGRNEQQQQNASATAHDDHDVVYGHAGRHTSADSRTESAMMRISHRPATQAELGRCPDIRSSSHPQQNRKKFNEIATTTTSTGDVTYTLPSGLVIRPCRVVLRDILRTKSTTPVPTPSEAGRFSSFSSGVDSVDDFHHRKPSHQIRIRSNHRRSSSASDIDDGPRRSLFLKTPSVRRSPSADDANRRPISNIACERAQSSAIPSCSYKVEEEQFVRLPRLSSVEDDEDWLTSQSTSSQKHSNNRQKRKRKRHKSSKHSKGHSGRPDKSSEDQQTLDEEIWTVQCSTESSSHFSFEPSEVHCPEIQQYQRSEPNTPLLFTRRPEDTNENTSSPGYSSAGQTPPVKMKFFKSRIRQAVTAFYEESVLEEQKKKEQELIVKDADQQLEPPSGNEKDDEWILNVAEVCESHSSQQAGRFDDHEFEECEGEEIREEVDESAFCELDIQGSQALPPVEEPKAPQIRQQLPPVVVPYPMESSVFATPVTSPEESFPPAGLVDMFLHHMEEDHHQYPDIQPEDPTLDLLEIGMPRESDPFLVESYPSVVASEVACLAGSSAQPAFEDSSNVSGMLCVQQQENGEPPSADRGSQEEVNCGPVAEETNEDAKSNSSDLPSDMEDLLEETTDDEAMEAYFGDLAKVTAEDILRENNMSISADSELLVVDEFGNPVVIKQEKADSPELAIVYESITQQLEPSIYRITQTVTCPQACPREAGLSAAGDVAVHAGDDKSEELEDVASQDFRDICLTDPDENGQETVLQESVVSSAEVCVEDTEEVAKEATQQAFKEDHAANHQAPETSLRDTDLEEPTSNNPSNKSVVSVPADVEPLSMSFHRQDSVDPMCVIQQSQENFSITCAKKSKVQLLVTDEGKVVGGSFTIPKKRHKARNLDDLQNHMEIPVVDDGHPHAMLPIAQVDVGEACSRASWSPDITPALLSNAVELPESPMPVSPPPSMKKKGGRKRNKLESLKQQASAKRRKRTKRKSKDESYSFTSSSAEEVDSGDHWKPSISAKTAKLKFLLQKRKERLAQLTKQSEDGGMPAILAALLAAMPDRKSAYSCESSDSEYHGVTPVTSPDKYPQRKRRRTEGSEHTDGVKRKKFISESMADEEETSSTSTMQCSESTVATVINVPVETTTISDSDSHVSSEEGPVKEPAVECLELPPSPTALTCLPNEMDDLTETEASDFEVTPEGEQVSNVVEEPTSGTPIPTDDDIILGQELPARATWQNQSSEHRRFVIERLLQLADYFQHEAKQGHLRTDEYGILTVPHSGESGAHQKKLYKLYLAMESLACVRAEWMDAQMFAQNSLDDAFVVREPMDESKLNANRFKHIEFMQSEHLQWKMPETEMLQSKLAVFHKTLHQEAWRLVTTAKLEMKVPPYRGPLRFLRYSCGKNHRNKRSAQNEDQDSSTSCCSDVRKPRSISSPAPLMRPYSNAQIPRGKSFCEDKWNSRRCEEFSLLGQMKPEHRRKSLETLQNEGCSASPTSNFQCHQSFTGSDWMEQRKRLWHGRFEILICHRGRSSEILEKFSSRSREVRKSRLMNLVCQLQKKQCEELALAKDSEPPESRLLGNSEIAPPVSSPVEPILRLSSTSSSSSVSDLPAGEARDESGISDKTSIEALGLDLSSSSSSSQNYSESADSSLSASRVPNVECDFPDMCLDPNVTDVLVHDGTPTPAPRDTQEEVHIADKQESTNKDDPMTRSIFSPLGIVELDEFECDSVLSNAQSRSMPDRMDNETDTCIKASSSWLLDFGTKKDENVTPSFTPPTPVPAKGSKHTFEEVIEKEVDPKMQRDEELQLSAASSPEPSDDAATSLRSPTPQEVLEFLDLDCDLRKDFDKSERLTATPDPEVKSALAGLVEDKSETPRAELCDSDDSTKVVITAGMISASEESLLSEVERLMFEKEATEATEESPRQDPDSKEAAYQEKPSTSVLKSYRPPKKNVFRNQSFKGATNSDEKSPGNSMGCWIPGNNVTLEQQQAKESEKLASTNEQDFDASKKLLNKPCSRVAPQKREDAQQNSSHQPSGISATSGLVLGQEPAISLPTLAQAAENSDMLGSSTAYPPAAPLAPSLHNPSLPLAVPRVGGLTSTDLSYGSLVSRTAPPKPLPTPSVFTTLDLQHKGNLRAELKQDIFNKKPSTTIAAKALVILLQQLIDMKALIGSSWGPQQFSLLVHILIDFADLLGCPIGSSTRGQKPLPHAQLYVSETLGCQISFDTSDRGLPMHGIFDDFSPNTLVRFGDTAHRIAELESWGIPNWMCQMVIKLLSGLYFCIMGDPAYFGAAAQRTLIHGIPVSKRESRKFRRESGDRSNALQTYGQVDILKEAISEIGALSPWVGRGEDLPEGDGHTVCRYLPVNDGNPDALSDLDSTFEALTSTGEGASVLSESESSEELNDTGTSDGSGSSEAAAIGGQESFNLKKLWRGKFLKQRQGIPHTRESGSGSSKSRNTDIFPAAWKPVTAASQPAMDGLGAMDGMQAACGQSPDVAHAADPGSATSIIPVISLSHGSHELFGPKQMTSVIRNEIAACSSIDEKVNKLPTSLRAAIVRSCQQNSPIGVVTAWNGSYIVEFLNLKDLVRYSGLQPEDLVINTLRTKLQQQTGSACSAQSFPAALSWFPASHGGSTVNPSAGQNNAGSCMLSESPIKNQLRESAGPEQSRRKLPPTVVQPMPKESSQQNFTTDLQGSSHAASLAPSTSQRMWKNQLELQRAPLPEPFNSSLAGSMMAEQEKRIARWPNLLESQPFAAESLFPAFTSSQIPDTLVLPASAALNPPSDAGSSANPGLNSEVHQADSLAGLNAPAGGKATHRKGPAFDEGQTFSWPGPGGAWNPSFIPQGTTEPAGPFLLDGNAGRGAERTKGLPQQLGASGACFLGPSQPGRTDGPIPQHMANKSADVTGIRTNATSNSSTVNRLSFPSLGNVSFVPTSIGEMPTNQPSDSGTRHHGYMARGRSPPPYPAGQPGPGANPGYPPDIFSGMVPSANLFTTTASGFKPSTARSPVQAPIHPGLLNGYPMNNQGFPGTSGSSDFSPIHHAACEAVHQRVHQHHLASASSHSVPYGHNRTQGSLPWCPQMPSGNNGPSSAFCDGSYVSPAEDYTYFPWKPAGTSAYFSGGSVGHCRENQRGIPLPGMQQQIMQPRMPACSNVPQMQHGSIGDPKGHADCTVMSNAGGGSSCPLSVRPVCQPPGSITGGCAAQRPISMGLSWSHNTQEQGTTMTALQSQTGFVTTRGTKYPPPMPPAAMLPGGPSLCNLPNFLPGGSNQPPSVQGLSSGYPPRSQGFVPISSQQQLPGGGSQNRPVVSTAMANSSAFTAYLQQPNPHLGPPPQGDRPGPIATSSLRTNAGIDSFFQPSQPNTTSDTWQSQLQKLTSQPNPQQPQQQVPSIDQNSFLCRVCQKPTYCLCSQCRSTAYCSNRCQVEDWQDHKKVCGKRKKILHQVESAPAVTRTSYHPQAATAVPFGRQTLPREVKAEGMTNQGPCEQRSQGLHSSSLPKPSINPDCSRVVDLKNERNKGAGHNKS